MKSPTDDQLFAEMLTTERMKIKTLAVKWKVKKQMLDAVCAAQEDDELMNGTSPKTILTHSPCSLRYLLFLFLPDVITSVLPVS